jgi:hypothetical protein
MINMDLRIPVSDKTDTHSLDLVFGLDWRIIAVSTKDHTTDKNRLSNLVREITRAVSRYKMSNEPAHKEFFKAQIASIGAKVSDQHVAAKLLGVSAIEASKSAGMIAANVEIAMENNGAINPTIGKAKALDWLINKALQGDN